MLHLKLKSAQNFEDIKKSCKCTSSNCTEIRRRSWIKSAILQSVHSLKPEYMCNDKEAEINSEMSTVFDYELEESLVLYVSQSHFVHEQSTLKWFNVKNVTHSAQKRRNFSIDIHLDQQQKNHKLYLRR